MRIVEHRRPASTFLRQVGSCTRVGVVTYIKYGTSSNLISTASHVVRATSTLGRPHARINGMVKICRNKLLLGTPFVVPEIGANGRIALACHSHEWRHERDSARRQSPTLPRRTFRKLRQHMRLYSERPAQRFLHGSPTKSYTTHNCCTGNRAGTYRADAQHMHVGSRDKPRDTRVRCSESVCFTKVGHRPQYGRDAISGRDLHRARMRRTRQRAPSARIRQFLPT
jgi:hypothetical protein